MTSLLPRRAAAGAALAAVLAAALAGCSSKKLATVHGTVLYKGQPLTSGIVRIYSGPDRMSMATLGPDGTFVVTDVPPGPVQVTVEPDPQAHKVARMGGGAAGEPAVKPANVPPRYADPKTSGLNYTVSSGDTRLEVTLE